MRGYEMVLKGKIIKILDKKRIIVDIGFNQNIKKDMKFFIYDEGDEVRDPQTNEFIDRLEIVKHRLKVSHIQEKFSIMRSNEYVVPSSIANFMIRPDLQPREIRPFTLKEKLDPNDENGRKKAIGVGDLVREDIS